jgi:hypothetical protein
MRKRFRKEWGSVMALLGVDLMIAMSRRGGNTLPLLDDCSTQARYCLDATDEVQDGAEWFADDEFDMSGVVPRIIQARE